MSFYAQCWEHDGHLTDLGYGRSWMNDVMDEWGGPQYTHRAVWMTLHGPITEGLELDHLCRNPACYNPTHLEPVTRSVNTRRGVGPTILAGRQTSKTHCPQGHPYAGENLIRRSDGARACRSCKNASNLRTYHRSKERVA